MAITADQAAQLASTYQSGDTSGLQGLVSSMGVTAGDVAQYFPGFDVGSLQGITLAPSAPAAPPAPTYGTSNFTGDVISNYIAANLQNPELIAQKAKEFGLSASDIQKAAGYSPEQQARFFSYAGVTPTGIAGLTPLSFGDKNQFTAKEVMDYVDRYVDDPTRIAQAAQRYTVTPEQIQNLYAGSATPYNLQQIKNYFETGQKGLPTRIQDIITSTIGGPDVLKSVENLLPTSAPRLSSFTPQSLSKKSIEEIEKLISESPTNKLQEANRIRNIAKDVYGFSADKAKQLQSDLIAGKDTDDFAEKLYGDLLKGGYTKDLQNKIFQDAAIRSPESKYFKENPEQLLYFTPIGERKNVGENSNQYGIDPKTGLPLIHLDAANRTLGTGEVFVRPFREEKGQGELGYHPHSAYAGFIARGVGIFGAKAGQSDIDYFDKIEKEIAKLGGVRTDTTTDPETGQQYTSNYVNIQETDPETGQKYSRKVNVENLFYQGEDETKPNRTYQEYLNTQNALRTAAEKAGIPETKYTSTKQAYEDLNNRFKDLYVIQGRTDTLDQAAAKTLGIPDVKENSKHATLLYQVVGDKLIPFTNPKTGQPQTVLKTFDFKDPNTTRGFFGDIAQGIASIPFVAELALLNPATAVYYPVIKGVQVGALTGDLEKAIKAGGLAYLTTQFIPKNIAPQLQTTIANTDLVKTLAQSSTDLANFVTQSGSRAIVSSGLAALTGQDPDDAALNALVSSGVVKVTDTGVQLANIPPEYRSIVSRILADTVLTGDAAKTLTNTATGVLKNEIKKFVKDQVKSDQNKTPTTKEIKV